MANALISDLILETRQRASLENSNVLTDAELLTLINLALRELYDFVTSANKDYFLTTLPFVLPANAIAGTTNQFQLPADFYKLRGVDLTTQSVWPITLHSYNFQERNRYALSYRVFAVAAYYVLQIMPFQLANGAFTVYYYPRAFQFASTVDATPLPAQLDNFREYVTVRATIAAVTKQELDPTQWVSYMATDLKPRIAGMLAEIDDGECEQVADVVSNRSQRWDPFQYPDR